MEKSKTINNIGEDEAYEAVRTLIKWAGDNPDRQGMANTPERVLKFYREYFSSYRANSADYSESIANDVDFDDFIMLRDIHIDSFCEHHMLPAHGTAHIAYIPSAGKVAGIGAIARIAADCSRKFTTQEAITNDIIQMMQDAFKPQGIAAYIELSHSCMTLRDQGRHAAKVATIKYAGNFAQDTAMRERFTTLIGNKAEDK